MDVALEHERTDRRPAQGQDCADMGEKHERRPLRSEQVDRLQRPGPGHLAVAPAPGKDARQHDFEDDGQQCGRQPGRGRAAGQTARQPDGKHRTQCFPSDQRNEDQHAERVARVHRVGQHVGRPVKRDADGEQGPELGPEETRTNRTGEKPAAVPPRPPAIHTRQAGALSQGAANRSATRQAAASGLRTRE